MREYNKSWKKKYLEIEDFITIDEINNKERKIQLSFSRN